ncbi:FadR/GntR family transcriptional regulator [Amycolatopsis pithecellobii]|uniref:GntR family transcriptional regulator n=1 Tax=Amycolatopsis pithecellobii TaxID=664692 RepID=A0A6N7YW05_9PSEU|nr:GntR family transcriptional regulator [Amycolatopsis pithecellobii]MTD56088.1 GntR family transcriptional regulator [Amycolatopsis pithecellobii]
MDHDGGPTAERASRTASSRPAPAPEFRRPQLADQVVGRLRALIAQGALAQGERLPSEAALSRELGVSRSTVREALKMLSHLGLVQTRAGSGSYVTGHLQEHLPSVMSGEELGELFEFRFILESQIAPLTAERRSTGQLAEVLYRLEQLHVAAAADDPDRLVEADLSFHHGVAAACGNRFLIASYSHHQPAFEKGTRALIGMQSSTHIADVHDELAEAIVAKDAGAAATAVRRTFDEIRMRLSLLTD